LSKLCYNPNRFALVVDFYARKTIPEYVENSVEFEYINNTIMPNGFVVLEDHLDIPETLGEVDFRNGKYNLILAQRTDKINDASLKLKEKGYYKNWSEDDFSAVVSWRFT
jgi:hypothetical protein